MLDLLQAWVLFPLILAALSLGVGLLVEKASGGRLPGVLLLPLGFAGIVVASTLVTAVSSTARFATWVVVALAVVGLVIGRRGGRLPTGWTAASVLLVFAVYALPVVLSGEATFAGYVKLDDTATWLVIADHVLQHGRAIDLPASSYQATLQSYVGSTGYPVGSMLPHGIGSKLAGDDVAWTFGPYLAYQAAMLALCFQAMLTGLVRSAPGRALAVFVAAQPALLFGYALWGSVKEMVAVPLIALLVVLVVRVIRERNPLRGAVPIAVTAAALLAAMSVGGGAWLALALVPSLLLLRGETRRPFLIAAGLFAGAAVIFMLPTIVTGHSFFNAARIALANSGTPGNLLQSLSVFQVVGIWLIGDFRLDTQHATVTYLLIGVTCLAAVVGFGLALRQRRPAIALYVAVSLIGAAITAHFGSPWVDAKSLAVASPALLLAGMTGAVLLYERRSRVAGALLAAAIIVGVGWSNVLAYHAVWLAPRDQLLELQTIGHRFPGQGPTLVNEYAPFSRHFLRKLDPQDTIALRHEFNLPQNLIQVSGYADIDEYTLDGVLADRTLVLPRSPVGSRPPSAYRLIWRGRYYDVWQRPAVPSGKILEHLSLGSPSVNDPGVTAAPSCSTVMRLAAKAAAAHGRLLYVPRAELHLIDLRSEELAPLIAADPSLAWLRDFRKPHHSGKATFHVSIDSGGRYGVWTGGSYPGLMSVSVDGHTVGTHRHRNEHPGQYVPYGEVELEPGDHEVTLSYSAPDWRPGSAANFSHTFDTIALAKTAEDVPFKSISPSQAGQLCGRQLDWIEAVS